MTLGKLQALIIALAMLVIWGVGQLPRAGSSVKQACAAPGLDDLSRRACADLRTF